MGSGCLSVAMELKKRVMRKFSYGILAMAVAGVAWADHEPEKGEGDGLREGHSSHGDAFNEGPRQAAYLMEHTGDVHFEVTTKSEEAQKFFNQGIGQLHGFWYFEAERSFRQALLLDKDCVMAYWGMAMSNLGNEKRAKGFIDKAVKAKDEGAKLTEWEKMWIDSTAGVLDGNPKDKKARRPRHMKTGSIRMLPKAMWVEESAQGTRRFVHSPRGGTMAR